MIEIPDLLPCPFCGGTAFLHEQAPSPDALETESFWYVACNGCINQTTHFYNGKDVVVDRWNARVAPTERRERIATAALTALPLSFNDKAIETIVEYAVKYADALIAALDGGNAGE